MQDLAVLVNLVRQHVGCPERVLATSPAEQHARSKTLVTLQTADFSSCLKSAQYMRQIAIKDANSSPTMPMPEPAGLLQSLLMGRCDFHQA